MKKLTSPLVHVPLYSWPRAPDHAVRNMVELHLACLESYFTHENKYDLLVTTNDDRALEVFSAYREKSKYRFELRFVSRNELLSTFQTDESRLKDVPCIRTIFSKFYPILKREHDAIVHVDFDTLFVSQVDLAPLFVSDVGLVDANQFASYEAGLWGPLPREAEFFRVAQPVEPVRPWINSGVFSVQRTGFDLCCNEIWHYLENLDRAIADGVNAHTDEMMMNALALRETDIVTVIPDYRYNFLAYFLKHDPSWTWRGQIVHFHALKPDTFSYVNGAVEHRCAAIQEKRINQDFYLAALMWFRHLHNAGRQLAYELPTLAAMPLEVVERELARLVATREGGIQGPG